MEESIPRSQKYSKIPDEELDEYVRQAQADEAYRAAQPARDDALFADYVAIAKEDDKHRATVKASRSVWSRIKARLPRLRGHTTQ